MGKVNENLIDEASALAEAAGKFTEWYEKYENHVKGLILLYADGDAEELLSRLRESFWAEIDLDV